MKTNQKLVAILAAALMLCSMLTIGVVAADPVADSELTIAEAIALGNTKEHDVFTEGKYYVTGVITEVYNTTYGNMRLTDEEGNILTIYGTYNADGSARYDAMEVKPIAGDTVTIYGVIGQYNGTPEMENGWIVEHTPGDTPPETPEIPDYEPDSKLTIAEAIALGRSKEHNTYTDDKYYVTGVIREVYNTTYGNMYLTDENGNTLTLYGTYGSDGTTRYDSLSVKPLAGDTITIYGNIGQYNGVAQIKDGWIVEHTSTGLPERPVDPENPQEYVFAEFSKGTSHALNEVHRLDNAVTVTTNDAYFTSELRLYGYFGTNAYAIIQSARPISAMVLKMGYSDNAPLNVRVSEDGASYSHYQQITTLTGAYRDDYVVIFDEATNYINLDTGSSYQIRIKSVTLYFDGEVPPEKEPCTEHVFTSEYDLTCNVCWKTIYTPEGANHPADGSHISITTANTIGAGLDEGDSTPYSYYITGIVTKASQNGDHLNLTIRDNNGNTFSSPSTLGGTPSVGDVVTFYHPIQNYYGSAQMKTYGYIQNSSACEYDHGFDTDCNVCGMTRSVPTPSFQGKSISEDVSGLAFRFSLDAEGIAIKKGTYVQADFTSATYNDYPLLRVGVVASNGNETIEIDGRRMYELDESSASFAYRIINIPTTEYDTEITMTPFFVVMIDGEEVTIYGDSQTASYSEVLNSNV